MTRTNLMIGAIGAIAVTALGLNIATLSASIEEPVVVAEVPAQPVIAELGDINRDTLHAEIRRYLLENPEIIVEVIDVLEAQRTANSQLAEQQMLRETNDVLLNDGYSFVGGNPDGDVTLVEFLDYQCTFCKRAHDEVAALLSSDGNIRLIVKEFPILGPVSETASRAALSVLAQQGDEIYEVFNDQLMRFPGQLNDEMIDRLAERAGADVAAMRANMNSREIDAQIAQNRALAEQLQITGTPTFVLGDTFIRGYLPADQMAEAVRLTRSTMR